MGYGHPEKRFSLTNEKQRRGKDVVYSRSTLYLAVLIRQPVAGRPTEIAKRRGCRRVATTQYKPRTLIFDITLVNIRGTPPLRRFSSRD